MIGFGNHTTSLSLIALLLATAPLAVGCKGCEKSKPPLATLASAQGLVTRDHAETTKTWVQVQADERFYLGDAVRTDVGSTARLSLSNGTSMALKESSVLRFLASRPDENNFRVELGEVVVQAGDAPLRFSSNIGLAVLQAGGSMIVAQDGKKLRFEVVVGIANFTQEGGEALKILPGQRIQVDLETALIERMPDATAPTVQAVAEQPQVNEASGADSIAAVVAGKRVRYRATLTDRWDNMEPGTHAVTAGGTFDIPTQASVRVSRGDEAATMHGRGQFRLGGDAGLVEATLGRVTIDRPAGTTVIVVPGGSITVKGDNSTGDVAVDASRTAHLKMREGSALVQTRTGSDEINAGEELRVDRQGRMQVDGRGPEVADLAVTAGESFVVHDPSPPTAVEVKFPPNCGKGGRLRIGASRFVLARKTSEGSAIANLTVGSHQYAVICGDAPESKGTIQITRDPGNADLPRLAPATIVDVDGRKYTILYQNLLPEVRVSWPNAPKAAQYQLVLTSGAVSKTVTTTKPKYVFKSSSIAEGNHSFVFRTVGTNPSASPETSVKIRFDNAAPAAVVRAPQNRKFKAGETVDVAGSALPGWVVTAQGAPLQLDPNRRFLGQVQSLADQRALAIRFEHRERGVHYYLRRSLGKVQ